MARPDPVPIRVLPVSALPRDLQVLVLAALGGRLALALLAAGLTLGPVVMLVTGPVARAGVPRPAGLALLVGTAWVLAAVAGGLRWMLAARVGPYRLVLVSYGGEGGFPVDQRDKGA